MHTRELPCFCKSVNRWVTSRSSNLRRFIQTFDPLQKSLCSNVSVFYGPCPLLLGVVGQCDWHNFDSFWPLLCNMGPKCGEKAESSLSRTNHTNIPGLGDTPSKVQWIFCTFCLESPELHGDEFQKKLMQDGPIPHFRVLSLSYFFSKLGGYQTH